MLKRVLAGVGAAMFMAAALPQVVQAQMPKGEHATISGTVIDVSCKFSGGQSGEQHRMCAVMCADAGVPLAILADDGTLYVPVSKGMPGSDQNELLKEYAEHHVKVSGTVFSAGGAKAIQIDEITKG